jgi:hypothetical protein
VLEIEDAGGLEDPADGGLFADAAGEQRIVGEMGGYSVQRKTVSTVCGVGSFGLTTRSA